MVTLADLTVSPEFRLDEVDACLSRWGAAVLPGWVRDEALAALRRDWQLIRDERNDPDSACIRKVGGSVADYAALYRSRPGGRRFPQVERICADPRIVALCDRYIGWPYLLNEEVYATYDIGRGAEIAGSHFDKTYNLKFMIYLDDNLESGGGAFSVHPGSQPIGRRRFREWFTRHSVAGAAEIGTPEFYQMGNEDVPDDLGPCVEILAPAGTLIIFGTDTFHRGSLLEPGRERRILRSHCYPGYRLPRTEDLIRQSSRQWTRGEPWETRRKRYSRWSVDGALEFRDHLRFRWRGRRWIARLPRLNPLLRPRNWAFVLQPRLYRKICQRIWSKWT